MSGDDSQTSGRRSKVARVIDDYGLEGMGERLERSWLGEGEPDRSLRELADLFNREVLEAAMRETELRPLDGEVDNLYRLMTDDDVSAGQRAEAEAKLQREGIDPADLRSDFVSHQAIHTYLTEHRNAEYPAPDAGDRLGSARETIQRTRGRLETVATNTLSTLLSADAITLGEFNVLVSITVYCDDCDTQYLINDLLDHGGCNCD